MNTDCCLAHLRLAPLGSLAAAVISNAVTRVNAVMTSAKRLYRMFTNFELLASKNKHSKNVNFTTSTTR